VLRLEHEVEQLRGELAEKEAEADGYFCDLAICAQALTRIDLVLNDGRCIMCALEAIGGELEEAEPAFEWALPMVLADLACAEDEEDEDLDVGVEDEAEDAPATDPRVIH
jgi:hypothetical protein